MRTSSICLASHLLDPISHQLLWNPVILNCCGQRLNHSTAVSFYGEMTEGKCAATNQKCSACMNIVQSYIKDRELERIVKVICGLINRCSFQDLFKILNQKSSSLSSIERVRDLFWENLNSLINDEKSLMNLRRDRVFQQQLSESCHVRSVAQIRASNPTLDDPLIFSERELMIIDVPSSLLVDLKNRNVEEIINTIFHHIFLLKGKRVVIQGDSKCLIQTIDRDENLKLVSIKCSQGLQVTLEDGDFKTSPVELYEQMVATNQLEFTVKSGQSLTFMGIDPIMCQKIIDKNIQNYQRLALVLQFLGQYEIKNYISLWELGSFSVLSNRDYTEITLIPEKGESIQCSLKACSTRFFTTNSFVDFLKEQGNSCCFTEATSLVFEHLSEPISNFCRGTAEEKIAHIFGYLAPLAGKTFQSFHTSMASSSIESSIESISIGLSIRGTHSVRIFFSHPTTFSFSNDVEIKNLREFFVQMQNESITETVVEAGQNLYIADPNFTLESLSQITKSHETLIEYLIDSLPAKCSMRMSEFSSIDWSIISRSDSESPVLCLSSSDSCFHLTVMPVPLKESIRKSSSVAAFSQSAEMSKIMRVPAPMRPRR